MKDIGVIKQIAVNAGKILLDHYKKKHHIDYKGKDPVTEADKEANEYIVTEIKKYFPEDGVIGEESVDDHLRLNYSRVWVVDPLDGTRHYINNVPEFSVMIGLAEKGNPVLGVVYVPLSREMFYAEKGKGAFIQKAGEDPKKLQVSEGSTLSNLNVFVSRSRKEPVLKILDKINLESPKLTLKGGMLKICLIAKGEADLFIDPKENALSEWDLCAPETILEEAGGTITDLKGDHIKYNQKDLERRGILVTNGKVHDKILKKLNNLSD